MTRLLEISRLLDGVEANFGSDSRDEALRRIRLTVARLVLEKAEESWVQERGTRSKYALN